MSNQREQAEFARRLFGELARPIDDALDRAVAETAPAGESFEDVVDAHVAEFREQHSQIAWSDAGEAAAGAVLAAYNQVAAAVAGSSVTLPAAERFIEVVDLGRLAARLEAHPDAHIVFAPFGLGEAGWRELYAAAAQRHSEHLASGEPLVIASEATREFALLDLAPPHAIIDGGLRWSMRLVPASPAPATLGLSFEHGPHVTLPEMLMLQLMRLAAGAAPLDQASFTWLEGGLALGKLGARHVYDAADRAVRVSCREVGNQGPHLGARPPVSLA